MERKRYPPQDTIKWLRKETESEIELYDGDGYQLWDNNMYLVHELGQKRCLASLALKHCVKCYHIDSFEFHIEYATSPLWHII